MSWWQRILHRPFFIRLLHWEFWSFPAVYIWVYPYWFYLCARSRSFFFFSASNPTIEYGGFLMESKKKIYDMLPPELHPRTILIYAGESEDKVIRKLKEVGFIYPLIAKPDIGGKGRGVKKVECEHELISYLKKFPFEMLVQEFVPYEDEIGVFYYRYPGDSKGRISGIVGKHFLTVKGNGINSIEELLKKDKRHILQLPVLKDLLNDELNSVLPAGEEKILVPYGNHARGALFVDYTHWVDEELTESIDQLCKRIPGFYFGRLDIRYQSLEQLKLGKEFSLIEVNGAGSEPTHMYDPRHSLFNAWREIIKHWNILYRVSKLNHKQGVKYLQWQQGVQMFKQARIYTRTLENIT